MCWSNVGSRRSSCQRVNQNNNNNNNKHHTNSQEKKKLKKIYKETILWGKIAIASTPRRNFQIFSPIFPRICSISRSNRFFFSCLAFCCFFRVWRFMVRTRWLPISLAVDYSERLINWMNDIYWADRLIPFLGWTPSSLAVLLLLLLYCEFKALKGVSIATFRPSANWFAVAPLTVNRAPCSVNRWTVEPQWRTARCLRTLDSNSMIWKFPVAAADAASAAAHALASVLSRVWPRNEPDASIARPMDAGIVQADGGTAHQSLRHSRCSIVGISIQI